MPDWKQIVGRCFTPHGFASYLESIPRDAWHPQFIVLRDTSCARSSPWSATSDRDKLRNLKNFHRNRGKNGSLRVLVTEDTVWVMSVPAEANGTGSREVEVVGDFDTEPLATGVRTNVKVILTAIKGGEEGVDIRIVKENVRISLEAGPPRAVCAGAGPM